MVWSKTLAIDKWNYGISLRPLVLYWTKEGSSPFLRISWPCRWMLCTRFLQDNCPFLCDTCMMRLVWPTVRQSPSVCLGYPYSVHKDAHWTHPSVCSSSVSACQLWRSWLPSGMPYSFVSSAQAFSQISEFASVYHWPFPFGPGPILSPFPDLLPTLLCTVLILRFVSPIPRKFASDRLRNHIISN